MAKISLVAARKNAGLTQAQVADEIRTSKTTISNWESGKSEPSWADFVFLCNLYGFAVTDIFLPGEQQKVVNE